MDPRARRTREALNGALVELMREKPLKSITVTELCKRAGVTRAAFYGHYHNVNDILLNAKNMLAEFGGSLFARHADEITSGNMYGVTHAVFSYFDEHTAILSILCGPNGDPEFLTDVISDVLRAYEESLPPVDASSDVEVAYRQVLHMRFRFAGAGFMNVLVNWVSDKNRVPVDAMSRLVAKLTEGFTDIPREEEVKLMMEANDALAEETGKHVEPEQNKTFLDEAVVMLNGTHE